jgi:hypothetical protein
MNAKPNNGYITGNRLLDLARALLLLHRVRAASRFAHQVVTQTTQRTGNNLPFHSALQCCVRALPNHHQVLLPLLTAPPPGARAA